VDARAVELEDAVLLFPELLDIAQLSVAIVFIALSGASLLSLKTLIVKPVSNSPPFSMLSLEMNKARVSPCSSSLKNHPSGIRDAAFDGLDLFPAEPVRRGRVLGSQPGRHDAHHREEEESPEHGAPF
jgi:hypothetical protein